jgi:DNA-3-methyladenine glycosylase
MASRAAAVRPAVWFDRPADRVAKELLGSWLVVRTDAGLERLIVTEAEAYLGRHDLACHGSKGMTRRNASMFGPAGCWYVYLCYGMHWMLNIVTGKPGEPAAVLLRGAGHLSGPGRLTRALGIDRSLDGCPATPTGLAWFEDSGIKVPRQRISRTPRIGVGYAGAWAQRPLRFVLDPAWVDEITAV